MKDILENYNFDAIWHFTDKSNIPLIQECKGILSLEELEKRRVQVPIFGGNDWSHDADKRRDLHKYVHLAFLDDHPMLFIAKQEYRILDPIWLKIDASIILEEGVLFTVDVSNKTGVEILSSENIKEKIDFEVLFTRTDWTKPEIQARRQAAIKSEILIPNFVPIEKILGYKNG
ncbi:MAG: DUF4433 domain-containing protein [Methylococcales symbiont of Hymedesmia sp. n. MRB-2018]|nr:MAG: DUF4433 domain-containing protein [Methylococcales symbiont of Hymedesmia sp. n. MRB-2018]